VVESTVQRYVDYYVILYFLGKEFLLLIQMGLGCVGPFLLLIQKGLGCVGPFLLLIQTDLDCVGPMSYMNAVLTSRFPAWLGIETYGSA